MAIILVKNLVVDNIPEAPPFSLKHARIGYQSICTVNNITVTSERPLFEGINVVDPLTYNAWQPDSVPASLTCDAGTAVNVDYLGIGGHTLGDSNATITIQHSTDGINWTNLAEYAPANNNPIMLISEEPIFARFWRVNILAADTQPLIGVIYIGEALQMQRPLYGGHSPIDLSRVTKAQPTESEEGQFLGRSVIRMGNATTFEWSNLTDRWYRDFFDPFVRAARTLPFFIAWYPEKFPEGVGYCWLPNPDIKPVNAGVRNLMTVSMTVKGLSDD